MYVLPPTEKCQWQKSVIWKSITLYGLRYHVLKIPFKISIAKMKHGEKVDLKRGRALRMREEYLSRSLQSRKKITKFFRKRFKRYTMLINQKKLNIIIIWKLNE